MKGPPQQREAPHGVAGAVLISYRDKLRRALLCECEDLLGHDKDVEEARERVREAESNREACRALVKSMGEDCEAVEDSFRQLTGRAMPAFEQDDIAQPND